MSHIPPAVLVLYQQLSSEVTWLHLRWGLYRQLFSSSEKRVRLLNECAPAFFFVIENVLADDVQLTVSKLLEPASNRQQENLSLKTLQQAIETHCEPSFAGQCRAALDVLDDHCKPIKAVRHKRLAHIDLDVALSRSAEPLPSVSRAHVEGALRMVREYLNGLARRFDDTEVIYDRLAVTGGGAERLVAMLRYGLRYQELQHSQAVPFDDRSRGEWHDA